MLQRDEKEKEKYSSKINSYDCSMPSKAGEDRNKQGAGDCSKPRPSAKNAGMQQAYITSKMPENYIGKGSLKEEDHSI